MLFHVHSLLTWPVDDVPLRPSGDGVDSGLFSVGRLSRYDPVHKGGLPHFLA
jgi:hypothetical protein